MAILQALLLALSRRAGQLVNTVFGWATQLLFGKVTKDKQLLVSGMSLGSVLWLISLIGIAFPRAGTLLLALIPLPRWVEHDWVRLIMAGLAVLIPLGIGWLGIHVMPLEKRPKTASQSLKLLGRGYAYAFGLSSTLVLMTLFAPFLMLPLMARRWITQHVPVIVESVQYDQALTEVETILADGGWKTQRQPASRMISLPTRILTSLAGGLVDKWVAGKLTQLKASNLELTLHPADLVISGPPFQVARARALLTERLAFSIVHQTWTKEGNAQENAVLALQKRVTEGHESVRTARQELKHLVEKRNRIDLEFEEWQVLERQQLLLERLLLESESPYPAPLSLRPLPTRPAAPPEESEEKDKKHLLVGAATLGGLLLWGVFQERRKHA